MVKKIGEKFNRLSRVHQRYRRQTDGSAIANSEREREFTSANKIGAMGAMVPVYFSMTDHGTTAVFKHITCTYHKHSQLHQQ